MSTPSPTELIDSCKKRINEFSEKHTESEQFMLLAEEYQEHGFCHEKGLLWSYLVDCVTLHFTATGRKPSDDNVTELLDEYLLGPHHLRSYEEYLLDREENPKTFTCSQPIPQEQQNGTKRDAVHEGLDMIFNTVYTYDKKRWMSSFKGFNVRWISRTESKTIPNDNIELEMSHFSRLSKNLPGSTLFVQSSESAFRSKAGSKTSSMENLSEREIYEILNETKNTISHMSLKTLDPLKETRSDGEAKRHSGIFKNDTDREEVLLVISGFFPHGFYIKDLRDIFKEIFKLYGYSSPISYEDLRGEEMIGETDVADSNEIPEYLDVKREENTTSMDLQAKVVVDEEVEKFFEKLSEVEMTVLLNFFNKSPERNRHGESKVLAKIKSELLNSNEGETNNEYESYIAVKLHELIEKRYENEK